MKNLALWIAGVAMLVAYVLPAAADDNPFAQIHLTPTHDTYTTHNDLTVHGNEPIMKVGIEPQECFNNGWDKCDDDDMVCCETPDTYNFCAVEGQCASADPIWKAHRKFRGYVRFDLGFEIPDGKLVSANLRFQAMDTVTDMGGMPVMEVYRLKQIGLENPVCEWDEATLNDTNGTTWSSLPQNVSVTEEGVWSFDVTKAVTDWLYGNPDQPGTGPVPNCGFHLQDPEYGNAVDPLIRWVVFSTKEGGFPPQLSITWAKDLDGDGHYGDCNEKDPEINPDAVETCDEVDNDCDDLVDEENCDGLDNDCDGLIDEGEDLCGDGQMCIFHQCIVTCTDDCDGPYDLTCIKNADGIWEKWACKNADDDPCLDWYKVKACDDDQYCQYGSCSSNCVDTCDPEDQGPAQCYEDSIGNWYLATCEEHDGDGCLEWGAFVSCGPAATCMDGACAGGCENECTELGATECISETDVVGCFDADGDGCLDWAEIGNCNPPDSVCEDGDCKLSNPPCVDDCDPQTTKCETFDDGAAFLYTCVVNGDEDPCFEWGTPEACPFACANDGLLCGEMPQVDHPSDAIAQPDVDEPVEEIIAQPDQAPEQDLPVGADSAILDGAGLPDTGANPQPDLTGGDGDDGGCSCNMNPTRRSFPLGASLLLLLGALALAFIRRKPVGAA
jgi:hypothetical protein